jgi:hypothetical protein
VCGGESRAVQLAAEKEDYVLLCKARTQSHTVHRVLPVVSCCGVLWRAVPCCVSGGPPKLDPLTATVQKIRDYGYMHMEQWEVLLSITAKAMLAAEVGRDDFACWAGLGWAGPVHVHVHVACELVSLKHPTSCVEAVVVRPLLSPSCPPPSTHTLTYACDCVVCCNPMRTNC